MNKKVFFIGHFSCEGAHINRFASAAGDAVQNQIVSDGYLVAGGDAFFFLSMSPEQVWPKGRFFVRSKKTALGRFIGYINLPFIKNIFFMIQIILSGIRYKPAIILQYNSYLFENIAVWALAKLTKARSCLILQDVKSGSAFNRLARTYDKLGNKTIGCYDFYVPITSRLVLDLDLPPDRCWVFPGGVTKEGYDLLEEPLSTQEYGVFAGALESYNGIEELLTSWTNATNNIELKIFGRGSAEGLVKDYCRVHKNITYYGFASQDEVREQQAAARYIFCLRYSKGIEEEYFFPSKFFNACCFPGILIVNDFKNLPDFMRGLHGFQPDLSRLRDVFSLSLEDIRLEAALRRSAVEAHASWSGILKSIFSKLACEKH